MVNYFQIAELVYHAPPNLQKHHW